MLFINVCFLHNVRCMKRIKRIIKWIGSLASVLILCTVLFFTLLPEAEFVTTSGNSTEMNRG